MLHLFVRLDKAVRNYDTNINENTINSNHSCKECINRLFHHIILYCKRNEKERKLLHYKLKPLG